uniref:RanBP2-type domain-containing protein n=1 Tax=Mucochytrium quahogii TaxID=96639 RepID=A0A7S2REC1_9STRA|mmetsp:Transcript_11499/g.18701  ORF Transcript_11499/g.18701 Transcript_11499/m.18701 type:complete len:125 (-) Transcript_11499:779-1153(-)|eukprot:CAMPEP_0203748712 /NCGR_PEP_ID=MMETSP0098-20131031/3528_1 /ASSEMBLY_ACC=CAM_ASM_000208 /TAXON_ID=96639 /ORGANISM=" , Strain NY0313808BC1" /LENGTH=124 /DNA_ID=CAMNT_0050637565 /DNA_START=121 /DNA_END=495 /DNA_ORIENTATION=+
MKRHGVELKKKKSKKSKKEKKSKKDKKSRSKRKNCSSGESGDEWYKSIVNAESKKPLVGTIHASETKKTYVKIGKDHDAIDIVQVPDKEELEKAKLFWQCPKCATKNYKTNTDCEKCGALRRMK